jgi:predicted DNA-binding transcriptional regulator AlpA
MSSEPDQISEPPIDPLLGQPRMVADPRISVAQAAEILGKTTERIYRLIQLGQLPRHGKPRKSRQLLLSDVLRLRGLGEPISIGQAARRLRGSPADVRRLIADGKLTLVPGSRRLLYPADVQRIARTWSPPASESQPSSPAGQVNTPAAGKDPWSQRLWNPPARRRRPDPCPPRRQRPLLVPAGAPRRDPARRARHRRSRSHRASQPQAVDSRLPRTGAPPQTPPFPPRVPRRWSTGRQIWRAEHAGRPLSRLASHSGRGQQDKDRPSLFPRRHLTDGSST